MKFYDRKVELDTFKKISQNSLSSSQMTVVVGRRRIGKTALLKKSIENEKAIYLFVARKNEVMLCQEFITNVEQSLNTKVIGEIKDFKTLFNYLMDLSLREHFTLIIDEFQEFMNISPSIFSDMQNIWDSYKDKSKINLILCGSIYSMMKDIFENSKQPLFARMTNKINVNAFSLDTLKIILKDNYPQYTNEDLLAFYLFTGGVAKYVELLVDKKAFTLNKILNEIFSENSYFLDEGKNSLIEEFGKDYSTYFSILSLIACSKTSRSDMESILEMSIGGFLNKLEKDYSLIKKVRPIFAKQGSKNIKYKIDDNFLCFWFRFIFKYRSAIEIGNYDYVKQIVRRDYNVFSGLILEKYFTNKLIESHLYSNVGGYWDKNNENEIDIIAVNDLEKHILIAEVKRNKNKIDINKLKSKAISIEEKFNDYEIEYSSLSIEDM
jgi:AAA+ ATPase superfamily predicted ATPase